MKLNTEHLDRFIQTLEGAVEKLNSSVEDSIEYDIFRNASIKGFELTLEASGKLLKKALKPYFATPGAVDRLVFKEIFRNASKHGLLTLDETERWFIYRDNRNTTAHDYGKEFVEKTLKLLPQFIQDAKTLKENIDHAAS
jgi:nucleotidyltransferase substrate binding protein (TIGR01987 family)